MNVRGSEEENLHLIDEEGAASSPSLQPHGLSPAQMRLWVASALSGHSSAYNASFAWKLSGRLDVDALDRAFRCIVRRHPALRTRFFDTPKGPVQVISAAHAVRLQRGVSQESDHSAFVARVKKEEASRPFLLDRDLPIRAHIIRLDEAVHLLLLSVHLLVVDGAAIGVMLRDLARAYDEFAFTGEESATRAQLDASGDYFATLRAAEWGSLADPSVAYWRAKLSGMPSELNLPLDRLQKAWSVGAGGWQSFSLDAATSGGLSTLVQQTSSSTFTVVTGVILALLHRYTGQADLCVGYPVANRDETLKEWVGCRVNTLPLRSPVDPHQSFGAFVRDLRQLIIDGKRHSSFYVDEILSDVRREGLGGRSPFSQVLINQNFHYEPGLSLSGIDSASLSRETPLAPFELAWIFTGNQPTLTGRLEFNADLFDRSTIERMVGHFKMVLHAVVTAPDTKIKDLPLLTEAERHQILVEWNDTRVDYANDKCIHELFEDQVARTPNATAVMFDGQQLTYGELNAKANQLAHYLRELGVKPDTLVAICMERSLEMVIGLLGILKSGGAYVPLDPDYPKERLAFMLEDTAAPVVLIQMRLKERLPQHQGSTVLLDADWRDIALYSHSNLETVTKPDHLAYCVYTSGSTGTPKGVLISGRSIRNLVEDWVCNEAVRPSDRFSLWTSIGFDVSVWEWVLPLTQGASLAIPTEEERLNPRLFLAWANRFAVTTSYLPPHIARALPALVEGGLAVPKRLLLGVEPLNEQLLRDPLANCRVVNGYGPTEATVYATTFGEVLQPIDRVLPIGRPIFNSQLYLLDAELRPVPVSVTGEIYIAGMGLARGYLGRPDLTAERFIPNPFGEVGSRMYRTGDLGRYLPDGNIQFLGRIDHQVKVRGFRIELGEIESALLGCEGVREAVVLAREDEPGDKRLVAYVVSPTTRVTGSVLRAQLERRLPEYMLPSAWVFLDTLPLNRNGKIDRKALPAPSTDRAHLGLEYVAPRTATEELLAGIWAEVLKVDRVGVHDNFFALGGHSLLATQAVARIRAALKAEVNLRDLFQAPKLAQFAEHALRQGRATTSPAITRVAKEGPPSSSFAQQRLWFLDQYEPGTGLYNIPAAWRIDGALDQDALEQSLNEVIRRHEVLRTSFAAAGQGLLQIIAKDLQLKLSPLDLSERRDAHHQAQRLFEEEADRAFDLANGPLIRARLIKLSETAHVLMLTLHHVIADGWSMGVLMRELCALYRAFSAGQASPLGELSVQYADFALWQREWLQGGVLQEQIDYWKRALEGAPPLLELPTDRLRPAVVSHRGAVVPIELGEQLSTQVRQFNRRSQVTLFMTLAAAFNVLLHRYSRQDDICIGYPVANRNRAEVEGLIGFFANTLVLRTQINPEQTFESLLRQVREAALDADAHQDLPFEKLVEELQPDRNLNHPPLFQVMLALNDAHAKTLELPGLQLQPLQRNSSTAKFDLTLHVAEHEHQLLGAFEYNTDLFDRETIERMVGHFKMVLHAVVTAPDTKIKDLPLLTEAERHQILVEWNDTRVDYANDKCIHELFEDQVARTPNATAVMFDGQQLTYGELNAKANQLAHYLRELGVKPDTLVAICMERSLEMVIGLLGILKSGGAYVPLDPDYPILRLQYMLADTQAVVLVTQQRLEARLPQHGLRTVLLDSDTTFIAAHSVVDPGRLSVHANLAYCIYTSGSTGMPKGATNSHQAIANRLHWMQDMYPLDDTDVVLQKTPFSFDVSVWEFFWPLMHGARLVVAKPEAHKDPVYIEQCLRDSQVTVLHFVPSMLQAFLDGSTQDVGNKVRRVFCSGEALPYTLFQRFRERFPNIALENLYGPTEAAVDVTYWHVQPRHDSKVLIGRPIANTQVYILDNQLQPVPVGVIGEIHLAGTGLGRGYLNNGMLTAAKFIPNPYGTAGCRLYKTGDLGRYVVDGNIEFLGRTDHQVKVRGFRIELGEIESALLACEGVSEAVVVAHGEQDQDKTLVAYVVGQQPHPQVHAIRAQLLQRVPEYLVPAIYVFLPALPLNANGKVDRKALPEPQINWEDSGQAYVQPRTDTEQLIASIWADVLKVPRVGVNDNFFALGGHSLRAAQVVARLREDFGARVSLRELFQAPTVAQLADRILDGGMAASAIGRRAEGDLPLSSFAQRRLWLLDQCQPGTGQYNLPVAWRIQGTLDCVALECAINELLRRHDALRTTFETLDDDLVQVIAPRLHIRLNLRDLSDLSEPTAQAQKLIEEEAQLPFDMQHGPLIRCGLLRLALQEHVLQMTLHHVVSDGWSMAVLIRELSVLYRAYSGGLESPLPELPIRYADYAIWQRRWLQGEVLQEQLEYWKRTLRGASAALELPTDRARPAVLGHRGQAVRFELGSVLSGKLTRLSRQRHVTLFMTMAAAFNVLLGRYSGQRDICIGYPVAGRRHAQTEGLVGFFVNTLVLRTRLQDDDTFESLLGKVKEAVLDADAHQDLPFERLVEELQPERSMGGHSPLFRVMLALNNNDNDGLQLPGLHVAPLPISPRSSKFDLTLHLVEREGDIKGSIEFNLDLYDCPTIERMVEHYRVLLEEAALQPSRPLKSLRMLGEQERQQLLQGWNDTAVEYPKSKCIHELFEERAARMPDAVALVFEELQLTYAQLNARANQLAHRLRELGVGPNSLVAICVERSPEMVVGLLGVLKAGGAYVPLDPQYPAQRLRYMLDDSTGVVLLTQQRLQARLHENRVPTVLLDGDSALFACYSAANPVPVSGPDNLAYCIYTSGSTGTPKGVAVSHRNLVASTAARDTAYGSTGRFLLLSSLSFDSSVAGIFGSLTNGGTLVVASHDAVIDPELLDGQIRQAEIETLLCVPSLLRQWLDCCESRPPPSRLARVIVAGEPFLMPLLQKCMAVLPRVEVFNEYGPTEATVWASLHRCSIVLGQQTVPIGRPISNAAIYLLDEHLDPVPIGVTGEVYVGGAGVARGYWKRPDLTAERFIPDPFGPPGARLYRTGDLARYSVDGDIEFLGRVDRQVKLRGLRIELGEVESALLSAPGVREAAVAIKSDAPTGEQQLVGYIAMREGHETARKLRDLLAERLPRYMVPTAFVLVDKLPLGPTGKIDRDALARLPMVAPNPSAPPTEEVGLPLHDAIRAIWMQLLQVEEVGIDDNFFDIGGSSMSLVRASRLMKDRIGFDVKVIDLFRYPTIRSLCASLAGAPTRAAAHPDHINRHEGNARLATLRQSKERRKAS